MLNLDIRSNSQDLLTRLGIFQQLASWFTGVWLITYALVGLGHVAIFQVIIVIGLEVLLGFTLCKFALRVYLYQSRSLTKYRFRIVAADSLILASLFYVLIYWVLSSGLEVLMLIPFYVNVILVTFCVFIIVLPLVEDLSKRVVGTKATRPSIVEKRLSFLQVLTAAGVLFIPTVLYLYFASAPV